MGFAPPVDCIRPYHPKIIELINNSSPLNPMGQIKKKKTSLLLLNFLYLLLWFQWFHLLFIQILGGKHKNSTQERYSGTTSEPTRSKTRRVNPGHFNSNILFGRLLTIFGI